MSTDIIILWAALIFALLGAFVTVGLGTEYLCRKFYDWR